MDHNKAHNKWKEGSTALCRHRQPNAFVSFQQTNKYFLEFLLLKNCRHKHYKVTLEFFKKRWVRRVCLNADNVNSLKKG